MVSIQMKSKGEFYGLNLNKGEIYLLSLTNSH